jgi:hypothetical protein
VEVIKQSQIIKEEMVQVVEAKEPLQEIVEAM